MPKAFEILPKSKISPNLVILIVDKIYVNNLKHWTQLYLTDFDISEWAYYLIQCNTYKAYNVCQLLCMRKLIEKVLQYFSHIVFACIMDIFMQKSTDDVYPLKPLSTIDDKCSQSLMLVKRRKCPRRKNLKCAFWRKMITASFFSGRKTYKRLVGALELRS